MLQLLTGLIFLTSSQRRHRFALNNSPFNGTPSFANPLTFPFELLDICNAFRPREEDKDYFGSSWLSSRFSW